MSIGKASVPKFRVTGQSVRSNDLATDMIRRSARVLSRTIVGTVPIHVRHNRGTVSVRELRMAAARVAKPHRSTTIMLSNKSLYFGDMRKERHLSLKIELLLECFSTDEISVIHVSNEIEVLGEENEYSGNFQLIRVSMQTKEFVDGSD